MTTNDNVRKDVLTALAELGAAFPNLRFGQMIENLAVVARGATDGAVWEMEDDELLAATRRQLDRNRDRAAVPA